MYPAELTLVAPEVKWPCQNHTIFSCRPAFLLIIRASHVWARCEASALEYDPLALYFTGGCASTLSMAAATPPGTSAATWPGSGPKVVRRRRCAICASVLPVATVGGA